MTRRGTWVAAAAAAVLLGIAFYVLIAWLEHGQLSDVPLYAGYANSVRGGAVPYRDFPFEYPPAALPPMLLATNLSWSYATSFAVLMGVCGAACIVVAASALRAADAGLERTWAALLAIGIALFASSLRRFAVDGKGTLAPWDPPHELVISGPYRYVRNPMIAGVVITLFAEAALLRSEPQFIWATLFLGLNSVYIKVVEEQGLEVRFGDAYRQYRINVPPVIPRLRPWQPRREMDDRR